MKLVKVTQSRTDAEKHSIGGTSALILAWIAKQHGFPHCDALSHEAETSA